MPGDPPPSLPTAVFGTLAQKVRPGSQWSAAPIGYLTKAHNAMLINRLSRSGFGDGSLTMSQGYSISQMSKRHVLPAILESSSTSSPRGPLEDEEMVDIDLALIRQQLEPYRGSLPLCLLRQAAS